MLNHGSKFASLGLMAALGVFAAVAFGAESRGELTASGGASPGDVIRPSADAGSDAAREPAPSQPARARAWRFVPEDVLDEGEAEAETEAPSRRIEVQLGQVEASLADVEDDRVEPEASIHTELGPPVFQMIFASSAAPSPSRASRREAAGGQLGGGYVGGSYGVGIYGADQPTDAHADAGPDAGDDDLLIMYSTEWCHVSRQARLWMVQHGIEFDERDVEKDPEAARRHAEINPRRSVPTFERSRHSLIGFSPASLQYFLDATQ